MLVSLLVVRPLPLMLKTLGRNNANDLAVHEFHHQSDVQDT